MPVRQFALVPVKVFFRERCRSGLKSVYPDGLKSVLPG